MVVNVRNERFYNHYDYRSGDAKSRYSKGFTPELVESSAAKVFSNKPFHSPASTKSSKSYFTNTVDWDALLQLIETFLFFQPNQAAEITLLTTAVVNYFGEEASGKYKFRGDLLRFLDNYPRNFKVNRTTSEDEEGNAVHHATVCILRQRDRQLEIEIMEHVGEFLCDCVDHRAFCDVIMHQLLRGAREDVDPMVLCNLLQGRKLKNNCFAVEKLQVHNPYNLLAPWITVWQARLQKNPMKL